MLMITTTRDYQLTEYDIFLDTPVQQHVLRVMDTARLPVPGQDDGIWGNVLNDYLSVTHSADGTLKDDSVKATVIADATIAASKLEPSLQAAITSIADKYVKPSLGIPAADLSADVQASLVDTDATTSTKGVLRLSGDLSGTATQPTVPGLASKVDKNTILHNVKDYGAVGDGTTDDTAAIVAALADGGITFFPAGTFVHTGLTLSSGAHLVGVGSSGYVKNYAPSNQAPVGQAWRSSLKLKNGANTHSITIPAGVAHGVIEYLDIHGNKGNQTAGPSHGIYLPSAANSEEAQWKFNCVYVHDTYTSGLSIGSNRQGCSTLQSVYFQCGQNDTTGGSGIIIAGSDTTVDTCFVGVCWSDSIKILSSVNRIISTEVFSNVTNASGAGAGIAIADTYGCSRNVIANCTLDRCAGHGLYVGTTSINNLFSGNIFHSNSQKTNGTYYHVVIRESGNLFVGNQIAKNDASASTNKPNYALSINTGKSLYGKNLNAVDAAAYITAAVNDVSLLVAPNL